MTAIWKKNPHSRDLAGGSNGELNLWTYQVNSEYISDIKSWWIIYITDYSFFLIRWYIWAMRLANYPHRTEHKLQLPLCNYDRLPPRCVITFLGDQWRSGNQKVPTPLVIFICMIIGARTYVIHITTWFSRSLKGEQRGIQCSWNECFSTLTTVGDSWI